MKIAIEGCAHGELDKIYGTLEHIEKTENIKIDLLLICGDFQSLRNVGDMEVLACPPKYRALGNFYQYYSGQKVAPYPTIFIGGNHEASNHLWELFHGGWICPNIYYLGFAGVIKFGGLRIGGLSGIYKDHDYEKGYYEQQPFDDSGSRSIYHVRKYNVYRLLQLAGKGNLDIFLSHDWPRGIAFHGNHKQLLANKQFLREEVNTNTLGSMPAELLLKELKPRFWFSAHLHVKFAALVKHDAPAAEAERDGLEDQELASAAAAGEAAPTLNCQTTKFLALDKCTPGRDFLQIIDVPEGDPAKGFAYDPDWLAIVRATNDFLSMSATQIPLPEPEAAKENIAAQLSWIRENLLPAGAEDIPVPHNFVITAPPHNPQRPMSGTEKRNATLPYLNPQTVSFCEMLQMENHINPAGQPPWTPPPPPPIAAAEVSSTSSTAPPEVGGLGELENLLKSGDMDLEHMSAKELLERLVQSKKTAQTTPNPVESTKQAETSDAKEEENGIS